MDSGSAAFSSRFQHVFMDKSVDREDKPTSVYERADMSSGVNPPGNEYRLALTLIGDEPCYM